MLLAAIFWKCKLYLQVLGYVLYVAVMMPKFYKITSLEKKKKIIRVFSKQHGLASRDSLVVGSISWGFLWGCWHRGGGVSSWYKSRVLGNLFY